VPSSSPVYLIFLAVVAITLPLLPAGRARWTAIALVSLGLYATFEPSYCLVLAAVTACSFLGARTVETAEGRVRTVTFAAVVALCLLPLLVFKYWPLLASGSPDPRSEMAWPFPVGLSFYTFVSVGYVVDVFVGGIRAERSFTRFTAFVTFFPCLTAGPIERGRHLLPQLQALGEFEYARVVSGLRAILIGLFMKVVLADSLAPIVDRVYAAPAVHGAGDIALATIYFSFQVYADFAGYSLIAIGGGRLLGIELLRNFEQPYLSESLAEFWRTWHISLASWFRDYVFTPLQLALRTWGALGLGAAILVTFILIGAWHGAGGTYVLFGAIHGVLLSFSALTAKRRQAAWNRTTLPGWAGIWFRRVATFTIVTSTFVLFRASDIPTSATMYRTLLTDWTGSVTIPVLWPLLAAASLVAGDLVVRGGWPVARWPGTMRWCFYHVAAASTAAVLIGRYLHSQPHVRHFIYFQF
jgi:D-alanyl-lipoteichoic acid acyltransferase DltB (MBOAT superfamily)